MFVCSASVHTETWNDERENKNNNEMELSEKFSYEPIYCTVNEAPMTAKEKERQEKKIKKNMKNTLAFYSEEF